MLAPPGKKQKRRVSGIDAESFNLSSQIVRGPASVADMFQWPDRSVQDVAGDADRWSMLMENMRNGVVLNSNWSGMRTAELVMQEIEVAFLKEKMKHEPSFGEEADTILGVVPGFSCDNDPVCISIAKVWQPLKGWVPEGQSGGFGFFTKWP